VLLAHALVKRGYEVIVLLATDSPFGMAHPNRPVEVS
jgi:hypothetical protein